MGREPGFHGGAHLAVIGLGLMGGSLAQALRGKCARIIGVDPCVATLHQALENGAIDAGYADLRDLPAGLDALILAAPIRAILQILARLPEEYPHPAIVMDLGSTKRRILERMQTLPPNLDPVGGHPMCGKENSGYAQAEPGIFKGAAFALTALERTSILARGFAEALAHAVGAVPLWVNAAAHDRMVAMTSHLPYLVANSLAAITSPEAAPLAGAGFLSTARLAPTSVDMMEDILQTNRENVLEALHDFQARVSAVAELLEHDEIAAWRHTAVEGANRYRQILENRLERKP